jgi:hypothetical protein
MDVVRLRAIHHEGQIGQPFYGWFTDGDHLFHAASAALFGEGR